MKKLAGRGGFMAVAVFFAIIGGLIGGLTGYSLEELVTQRRRDKIRRENTLMTIATGDMEIPYASMSQVELTGARFKIFSGTGPLTMVMPKKYPAMISAKLRELIPSRCWASSAMFSA